MQCYPKLESYYLNWVICFSHENAILHAQEAVIECAKELELKKKDNLYNEKV